MPDPDTGTKPVRFTSVVRRGLAHMRSLLIDSMDDTKPPASKIVAGWKQRVQDEFNRAMDWIEQN